MQDIDYDGWKFPFSASGPFGEEAPGQWMPFGDAILDYLLNVRDCPGQKHINGWLRRKLNSGWFDIHATLNMPKRQEAPYPRRRPQNPFTLKRMKRSASGRLKKLVEKFSG